MIGNSLVARKQYEKEYYLDSGGKQGQGANLQRGNSRIHALN